MSPDSFNKLGKGRFYLCVVLLLIITSLLRVHHIINLSMITHDEAISYQAATVNQGAYNKVINNKEFPYGSWAKASDWQAFYKFSGNLEFKRIQQDLVAFDVHPPLYFWLLHLWVFIVGVHIWTGPLLNILIGIISCILLLFIYRRILKDDIKALAIVTAYMFSPGVMSATFIARNYELFSLLSIIFLWLIWRFFFEGNISFISGGVSIFAVVFLGLMNHYYFGLFASAAILAFFVYFIGPGKGCVPFAWKKLLILALSSLSGLVAMLLIHPGFFVQFFSFKGQGQPFTIVDLVLRFLKTGLAILGYFVEVSRRGAPISSIFLLVLFMIILSVGFIKPIRSRLFSGDRVRLSNDPLCFMVLYFSIAFMAMISLYLSFFTHQAVMGPQYLSPLFVIFSLFPIIIFRSWGNKEYVGIFLFVSIMVISGLISVAPWHVSSSEKTNEISTSSAVLIDNPHRGILPRLISYIPPDKKVFCATQDDLLLFPQWVSGLKGKTLYLSVLEYGNTKEKRTKIIDSLLPMYRTKLTKGGSWGLYGLGQSYLIIRMPQ